MNQIKERADPLGLVMNGSLSPRISLGPSFASSDRITGELNQLQHENKELRETLNFQQSRAECLMRDKAALAKQIEKAVEEKEALLSTYRTSIDILALENERLVQVNALLVKLS